MGRQKKSQSKFAQRCIKFAQKGSYVDFTSFFARIKMKKNGASGKYCQDIRISNYQRNRIGILDFSQYRMILYFKTDDL